MNLQNSSRNRQSVVSTKSWYDKTINPYRNNLIIVSSILSSASNQRKLNRNTFADSYEDFCHLQHTNPLQVSN